MTAVAALFWQTMAMQVKTEENTAERSSTVSVVRKISSPGTLKVPISGIPTQRQGSRYAAHMASPAAQETAAPARQIAERFPPTIILFRMVPSLYSVPMNRLQNTDMKIPMNMAQPKNPSSTLSAQFICTASIWSLTGTNIPHAAIRISPPQKTLFFFKRRKFADKSLLIFFSPIPISLVTSHCPNRCCSRMLSN